MNTSVHIGQCKDADGGLTKLRVGDIRDVAMLRLGWKFQVHTQNDSKAR